jgi:basic membrane protein A and related proteins
VIATIQQAVRSVVVAAVALGIALTTVSPAQAASPPPGLAPRGAEVARVAVAYDLSGRGDGGFNDIAYNGAARAAQELGAELLEVTAKLDDTDVEREERLRLLADAGYNPIIGVGFTYAEPMRTVAADFPDTFFAIVDDASIVGPNIATITFKEHEGSFLVGVAAGLRTQTGRVGFVGAVPVPLIQRFEAGYAAGARAVRPDIVVDTAYLSEPPDYSGFGDPAMGREATLGLVDAGADIVFQAAGGSGQGVIEAAAATDTWAIGVDADMYLQAPEGLREHILTSMLKNADVGTYAFVRSVADGTFLPGHRDHGIAEGGVGYTTSGGFIDDLVPVIESWAARIASGAIVVPEVPQAP